ncbi:TetR/AcrR family transcriptional regulator [Gracilibacillus massiliensis]|uniref:TetR/AcrR family transcriptional regulator n=1 Tax=Gracilibacillus massiliensis TaxID=1564956 RepID=UPI00071C2654|nr:TetR/AcrR family transcriptional regulator [Gracilibacillus massiliensis]
MKKSNGEEAKQKIIDAARSLFISEGYHQVSMRKIANTVGYSPTNIYNYFQNKDELVFHLLQDGYQLFYSALKAPIQEDEDTPIRLKKLLHAYIQFSIDSPEYYELIFVQNLENQHHISLMESDRLRGFQLLVDQVEDCIKEGWINEKDAVIISQSIWAHLHGIASLLISFQTFPWKQKQDLISFHINTYLNGIIK